MDLLTTKLDIAPTNSGQYYIPHGHNTPAPISQDQRVQVILADRYELIRAGLRSILATDDRFQVVAEVGNFIDLLALARDLKPHVVIIDANLPKMTTLADIRAMAQGDISAKVIVLADEFSRGAVLDAVVAGSKGYWPKSIQPDELVRITGAIATGAEHFHPHVMTLLREGIISRGIPLPNRLTAREKEMVEDMANGLSTKDIAKKNAVGYATAKQHIHNVLRKLGASNRVEALRIAQRLGLIAIQTARK